MTLITAGGLFEARSGSAVGAAETDVVASGEGRGWGVLAVGSLAIAGVFALLLAASRIPGSERIIPWPVAFFGKGLVIHVAFSFVVWFLTVFAMLSALAFQGIAVGIEKPRLTWAGPAGMAAVSVSFPLLLIPSFLDGSVAALNNYVPVIDHPLYEAGLALLYIGVLMPVVRLLANALPSRRSLDPLSFGIVAGGIIYIVALVCMGSALELAWNRVAQPGLHEDVFWGGGHILQFLNCLMMLYGWHVLARSSFGEPIGSAAVFKVAAVMLVVFVLPAPAIYAAFPAGSSKLRNAFTFLQFALAGPTLLVAIATMSSLVRRLRAADRLPFENVAFLAVVLSPFVFGVGGTLGFLVDGTDTRTPAHYHGVIAAVNLAFMGVFLCQVLPALRRPPTVRPLVLKLQIVLFGLGQLLACIGLFWAGGYGAPRKVAGEAQGLVDGAMVGMYLNGIGALIAVIGGVMFIWTVLTALLRRRARLDSRGFRHA